MVLGKFFLIFSNVDVQFAEKELTWKIYTTKKALPTTYWVKLINQKEFAKGALDGNIKHFMVHISFLRLRMTIDPARKAQMALLLAKKVTIPVEYSDFADMFLEKSANIILVQTGVNEHNIKFKVIKQSPYRPIYSLGPIEFKIFKIYIKTIFTNSFINASCLLADAPILFVRKPNDNFCLCVNH